MSGHSRNAKKVSITGAGSLRECKNTEFVHDGSGENGILFKWP